MRLTDTKYNYSIEFKENKIQVLTVENTEVFSHILEELTNQLNGAEGSFILAENEKLLSLSKKATMIINPFDIDCNDKRVVNALYSELNQNITEDYYKEFNSLVSEISIFIEKIANSVPYPISYNDNLEKLGLFKYCELRIDANYDNLLERVTNYLRVLKDICKIDLVVFINIKDYFSEEELLYIYKFCFQKKIFMIIVEGHSHNYMEDENVLIIDKDLCYINVEN